MSYTEKKTNIEVVLLGAGYQLHTDDQGGQSGTKIFHEASFQPNIIATDIVFLPDIGDSWSEDVPECKVISIDMKYVSDRTTCGRMWTINYNTVFSDANVQQQAPFTNEEDLKTTIELGSEQVTFEPPEKTWMWYNIDGLTGDAIYCTSPMFFNVSTATIKIYRTIYNNLLFDFTKANFACMGKTNDHLFWHVPQGMMLYEGANLQEHRDALGNRVWETEMVFHFRSVTGDFAWSVSDPTEASGFKDGWNWIIAPTTAMNRSKWNKPNMIEYGGADRIFLYQTADFDQLITTAGSTTAFPNLDWMF